MKDDLKWTPAKVTFPVAYGEKEKINVQLFTTEIVVKSLVAKKRPIIWIKEKGLSDYAKKYVGKGKKTYLVFTQYDLEFVGSFAVAREAARSMLSGRSVLDSSRLKFLTAQEEQGKGMETPTAKEIAARYKVHSIGFLSCGGDFLEAAQDPQTAVRAIIDDDVETIKNIFDIKTKEDMKEFFAKPCTGLRCTPMEFAALCGSIKCFKYMIMNGAEINKELFVSSISGWKYGDDSPYRTGRYRVQDRLQLHSTYYYGACSVGKYSF